MFRKLDMSMIMGNSDAILILEQFCRIIAAMKQKGGIA
jgi:hypothetical protein